MGRCKASVCSPLLGPLCLHLVPFLLLISRPGGFALPGLCLGLIHIFTQTLHTTCVQEVTPNSWTLWKPQLPEGHRASLQT